MNNDVERGFSERIDLAARRLGGMVLDATDEFFGAKERLLEPGNPAFDPDLYSDRGKVMDGWETRRRRGEGHDSCVIRLGIPGVVEQVVVDTTHFRGNAPASCWIEGRIDDHPVGREPTTWLPLLNETPLQPHAQQVIDADVLVRISQLRFSIAPDGGVARIRLLGRGLPDLRAAADPHGRLDLAAAVNGGRAVGCSDEFFSSPHNLVMVGDARDMSDGWETRRRRGPGQDWAVVELATTGIIDRIELDTTHFKGNYPDRCAVDGVHAPGASLSEIPADEWEPILAPVAMEPHAGHRFDVTTSTPTSHLRLQVLPDGGVARLRAFGTVDDEGWRRHGLAQLNVAHRERAEADLLTCCGSTSWARRVAASRPFSTLEELDRVADEVWNHLDVEGQLEAFATHPRIGDRTGGSWSSQEQSGAMSSDETTLQELAAASGAYEERFDQVFLICATGKSAAEILAALRERMDNEPDVEHQVAAGEQRKITHIRLAKLLRDGRP